jgi:hypothetical protein
MFFLDLFNVICGPLNVIFGKIEYLHLFVDLLNFVFGPAGPYRLDQFPS